MPVEVVMPALGLTVEKGIITKWLKGEGEAVKKGEPLFEVEADKVATEVESPASGTLAKILIQEGVEVPILTVVGVIAEAGEALPAEYVVPAAAATPPEAEATVEAHHAAAPRAPSMGAGVPGAPIRVVPAARRLARERGLALETVTGTGPEGVILVRDVEAASTAPAEAAVRATFLARKVAGVEGVPLESVQGTGVHGRVMRADVDRAMQEAAPPTRGEVIPMSRMRKVIARRMSESYLAAPHIYFFTDVWMDPLLDFRKEILPDFEEKFELRPSINDFLIKAVAMNLVDFPMLNAIVKGEEIHILPEINVCLAVALPEGLIVPAISRADTLGIVEICRQRKDLVQRATEGKLTMDELERGTFTISSLAQYDITHFTAILNPPQSGILSVGKTREQLAMVHGEVIVKRVTTLGLGVDHRIIDGAVAADFLQNLKQKLERPQFSFLQL
ncbi:MAG: dihydrolipoamide acetyltransferase family protein [Desulfobacteraceae bacterium]|jgi:pyruvate dehydrogenase E2 component (dihydrolipoamide acetyltransferase)